MSSQFVRITTSASTTQHFPSDGKGGFTSLVGSAALAATYTASGATLTGGAVVPGSAGDTGYCFTTDSYYAPYRVVTPGANGTIEVDIWRHINDNQLGRLPTGNITFHSPSSTLATFQGSFIESIVVRVSGAGDTIAITDPKGTTLDLIVIPANMAPGAIPWPIDGKLYPGPFGFQMLAGTVVSADIVFRPHRPVTKASRLAIY